MAGPLNINGEFWHQAEDGSWFKWNTAASRWDPSAQPPPQQVPTPSPPPPPPPRSTPSGPAGATHPAPGSSQIAGPDTPQTLQPSATPATMGARSASAHFVSPSKSRGLPPVSPLVFVIAGAVLLLLAFIAFLTLTQDDDPEVAAPPAPLPTYVDTRPVSRRGERNIYDMRRAVRDCFSPETLAWSGELRAGALDRAGLKDDIARISRNLEDVRGRRFPGRVKTKIVPRHKVRRIAGKLAAAEINTGDVKTDGRIMIALGLLPKGTNLEKLSRQVVDENLAGFYLPEDKKLYAGIGPEGFVAFDEIVLAHELDHALIDATIGLPLLASPDRMDDDKLLAQRAAIEGEATLAMLHYAIASLDPSEWQELLTDPAAAGSLDTSRVPGVLERALTFPYAEGLLFACDQFSRGEWKDVDRTIRKPPNSTAQVLFPDRYLRAAPVVDAPDPVAPAGWEEARATSFGAADLLWMLQAARGTPASKPAAGIEAVRGWAGGELHAWQKGRGLALQITLVDGGIEAKKNKVRYTLCRSLQAWYENRFHKSKLLSKERVKVWRNGDTFAAANCAEKTPRLALAPDRGIAEALVQPD